MNPAALAPESPVQSAPADPCPRCGAGLTDAAGLGWCQACGYCRSLEEERAKDHLQPPAAAAAPAPVAMAEAGKLVNKAPLWLWVLIGGAILMAGGSLLIGRKLPLNSYPRALWTTLQIALGLLTMFIAQFTALVKIAHHDETLTFKDSIFPGRLWSQAFKRMPGYGPHFCVTCWGLILVVCAFAFIGGLNHWLKYLPNNKNSAQSIRK